MRVQWSLAPWTIVLGLTILASSAAAVGSLLILAGFGTWRHVLVLAVGVPIGSQVLRLFEIAGSFPQDPLPPVVRFRTERLEVRRLQRSDSSAFEASLDADMIEANGWTPQLRRGAVAVTALASDLGRAGQLIAVDNTTGDPVAFASVSNDGAPDIWTMGFRVTPEKRGHGLATEAMTGILGVLHDTGIAVVHIGTGLENLAMQAVLNGAGAVLDDVRDHELPNGTMIRSCWYSHREAN